jgi:hypothetical protein
MNRLPHHQADDRQQVSVRYVALTAPTTPGEHRSTESLVLQPEWTEVMVRQLEVLLRTHGAEEARSDQSSLGDILVGLRDLADELGLDFGAALAGSAVGALEPAVLAGFDPSI